MHLCYGLNLFWVGIYPSLVDDETKELPRADPEDAFREIQEHVEPPECLVSRQVSLVHASSLALYDHVIHIYFHVPPDLVLK